MVSLREQIENINDGTGIVQSENPTVQHMQETDPQAQEFIADDAVVQREKRLNNIENTFDYLGARNAGASDEQILAHLEQSGAMFDIQGAKSALLEKDIAPEEADRQILAHLYNKAHEAKQDKQWDEDVKALGPSVINSDFHMGVLKTMTGVSKAANDIRHAIGRIDDKEYNARFEEIDKWTKMYIRNRQDKDFFSKGTAGEVFPSLITLPFTIQSKLGIFAVEGMLGYATARATEDKGTSAALGLASGIVSAGAVKIMEKLSEPAKKNVYQYYKSQFNLTDDEADKIYTNWAGIESTDGSYGDKTRALLDYMGEKGAKLKMRLAGYDPDMQKAMDEGRVNRRRVFEKLIDEPVDTEGFSIRMRQSVENVKANYNTVKKGVINKAVKVDNPVTLPEELEAIATDRTAIKRLLGKPDVTIKDYLTAMPHINSVLRKVKGVHLNDWTKVKDKVEKHIKNILEPEDYIRWKEVNADYIDMIALKESKVGEALLRATGRVDKKKQITSGRVLELLQADRDSGELTFEAIQNVIGSKDTYALENLIIKEAFGDHIDDLSWKTFSKALSTKGFVTKQGKQIQQLADDVAKAFRTDDVIRAIALRSDTDVGGLGSDMWERFKVFLTTQIVRRVLKMFPGKSARAVRMEDRLANILKTPSKMKEVQKAINELTAGVKNTMIQDIVRTNPKLLEWKPDSVPFTKTNEPLYVTSKGKQAVKGREVSKAVQSEDLIEWIRDVKLSAEDSKAVIDSTYKIVTDTRMDKLLKHFKRMKVDTRNNNVKSTADYINKEAKILIGSIQRDSGVKLSKKDAEKLTNRIIERYNKALRNTENVNDKLVKESLQNIDTTASKDLQIEGLWKKPVSDAVLSGDPKKIRLLPKNVRQTMVDKLFSSRSLEDYPKGIIGNQSKSEHAYRGFTIKTKPSLFKRLSEPLDYSPEVNNEKALDFSKNILKEYKEGKIPRVAPPILFGEIKNGKLFITGHEGRHRTEMVRYMFHIDIEIPVDIQIRNRRFKDLTGKELDMPLVNEKGREIGKTLRDLIDVDNKSNK